MLDISNYYEQLVIDRLWKIKADSVEPLSHEFIEDVACLALNQLPPCYLRNPVDKAANTTERQSQAMLEIVDAAIKQALQQVRHHPHDARET